MGAQLSVAEFLKWAVLPTMGCFLTFPGKQWWAKEGSVESGADDHVRKKECWRIGQFLELLSRSRRGPGLLTSATYKGSMQIDYKTTISGGFQSSGKLEKVNLL